MKQEINTDHLVREIVASPVGPVEILASDQGVHEIHLGTSSKSKKVPRSPDHPVVTQAKRQLREYFAGKRRDFDLPLVFSGTEFQKNAWKQLQRIPYGKTISYGEQARRMGRPKAARAVGGANAKNPLPIVIPCHRVIGSSGDLTGFSGGGVEMKLRLLQLEQV